MLGDGAYDRLECHDHLLAARVVPIVPYNPRNTDDPKTLSTGSKLASTNTVGTYRVVFR
jgi:hypothetical protein